MKRPKITENLSEEQVKDSANFWSNKAVSRAAENAALRKRIKVLTDSREGYKTKCKILAERLVQKKNATTEEVFLGDKASGDQYSLAVVCMRVALGLSACLPHLLVSLDIIESFFGKFKTKINANNRSGLTAFVFTIANFSQSFSVEETKNALESVQLKDLKLVKNREKPA